MPIRLIPQMLERRVVPKVWGGRELERVLQIRLPGDEPVGETWEVYDRPDGASLLAGGGGATIADLVRENATGWLGRRFAAAARFPLLLKFIDAREALSVQLHPDDAAARSVGDLGKTEAWVVLDAGANARIVRGLRAGVDRSQLVAAIAQANGDCRSIEAVLHSFRPAAGDAILVPAGTVHAIGPDVVVFEVQQNSDLTYRLYDWGRPRELHIDAALAAYRDLDDPAQATIDSRPTDDGGTWLVRHELFSVRRYQIAGPSSLTTDGCFKILNVIAGQGTIGWRSGGDDPPLFVRSGDTLLVPAALEQVFLSPVGRFELLWTAPGENTVS